VWEGKRKLVGERDVKLPKEGCADSSEKAFEERADALKDKFGEVRKRNARRWKVEELLLNDAVGDR